MVRELACDNLEMFILFFYLRNIDASETLCRKSKDEVIQEVKECIRKAAPGGGFILCSSNSWYAEAKLENCLAMIEAGRKYGKYPVSIANNPALFINNSHLNVSSPAGFRLQTS